MAEFNMNKMTKSVAERAIQELKDNGVFVARWIPVSEGLPEKDGWYLVTERGKVESRKWERNERFPNGLIGWQSNFCAGITAWMPLPEPYKAESEDKE